MSGLYWAKEEAIFVEIRVLRYFLAVAREENVSRAAEALHLSQPTLSRQLMDLEAELGKQLFIRGSRRITLTEDGILLRKRASEIVELVEKTESEFREGDEPLSGEVYIGGGETEGMRLIGQVARELQAFCPRVRYHLFSGNIDDLSQQLEQGLLDFMLMPEPGDLKKYDCIKLPYADSWGVLLRRDHPLAQRAFIRAEDLWEEPLILSRQQMGRDRVATWFRRDYDRLNIVATYNLIYNASLLVAEGVGCALCLDGLVRTTDSDELCFRPIQPRLDAALYLVWKKHQVFSKAAGRFFSMLRERIERGIEV